MSSEEELPRPWKKLKAPPKDIPDLTDPNLKKSVNDDDDNDDVVMVSLQGTRILSKLLSSKTVTTETTNDNETQGATKTNDASTSTGREVSRE